MWSLSYFIFSILFLSHSSESCTTKKRGGVEHCCLGFIEDSNGKCVSSCNNEFDKSPKIVIIGAGPSGIAAATRLLSHGFTNVTIVEAQNRIGGRINTVPFGDDFIDMGAQWCHGEENNVVYEMVHDKNLLDKSKTAFDGHILIRSNSEVVSEEEARKLKDLWDECEEEAETLLKSYNDSLGAYFDNYFTKALSTEKYASLDQTIAKEYLTSLKKGLNTQEGSKSIYNVSGKGYLEYETCEGNQAMNWKGKGYITILYTLMDSNCKDFGILNKKILLNQEILNINWDPSGDQQAYLEGASGINHTADHVIFTGSVGVLRDNIDTLFSPKLPSNKYLAARGLGFETVNKFFLYFDSKWWTDNFKGFTLQWKESDLEELRKTDRAWLEYLFGFFTVNYQPKVLSGWIVGDSAVYIESLPKSKLVNDIMYALRRFLNNPEIPNPIDFINSSWNSNKFVRGSYSHRSMTTEELGTGASDLAEPIIAKNSKPVIQFAGEATHSYYYSTVHGAIESGWREADRIYEYYCKNTKNDL